MAKQIQGQARVQDRGLVEAQVQVLVQERVREQEQVPGQEQRPICLLLLMLLLPTLKDMPEWRQSLSWSLYSTSRFPAPVVAAVMATAAVLCPC